MRTTYLPYIHYLGCLYLIGWVVLRKQTLYLHLYHALIHLIYLVSLLHLSKLVLQTFQLTAVFYLWVPYDETCRLDWTGFRLSQRYELALSWYLLIVKGMLGRINVVDALCYLLFFVLFGMNRVEGTVFGWNLREVGVVENQRLFFRCQLLTILVIRSLVLTFKKLSEVLMLLQTDMLVAWRRISKVRTQVKLSFGYSESAVHKVLVLKSKLLLAVEVGVYYK